MKVEELVNTTSIRVSYVSNKGLCISTQMLVTILFKKITKLNDSVNKHNNLKLLNKIMLSLKLMKMQDNVLTHDIAKIGHKK